MVDTFDLINDFIAFDNPNEFYFVQIIRRAKDNNEIGSNNEFIKSYNVYSHRDLQQRKIRITDLCNKLNARAYIHLAPRNDETIALMMLEELAKIMRERQYANTRNLFATMCGRYNPPKGKKLWIIDIDNDHHQDLDEIVPDLAGILPIGPKVLQYIPTKSGVHLITCPFDMSAFHAMYRNIDVHKNNPTVLYCP